MAGSNMDGGRALFLDRQQLMEGIFTRQCLFFCKDLFQRDIRIEYPVQVLKCYFPYPHMSPVFELSDAPPIRTRGEPAARPGKGRPGNLN
ncbi:hypothetical protein ACU8OQ_21025 [Rhizobium leguminosarum]